MTSPEQVVQIQSNFKGMFMMPSTNIDQNSSVEQHGHQR